MKSLLDKIEDLRKLLERSDISDAERWDAREKLDFYEDELTFMRKKKDVAWWPPEEDKVEEEDKMKSLLKRVRDLEEKNEVLEAENKKLKEAVRKSISSKSKDQLEDQLKQLEQEYEQLVASATAKEEKVEELETLRKSLVRSTKATQEDLRRGDAIANEQSDLRILISEDKEKISSLKSKISRTKTMIKKLVNPIGLACFVCGASDPQYACGDCNETFYCQEDCADFDWHDLEHHKECGF